MGPYLTLEQLRTPMTGEQCLQSILNFLEGFGFSTSSWQSGSVQLTMLRSAAEAWSLLTTAVDQLSRAHFLSSATGTTLTALADSHYDVQREEATRTLIDLELVGGPVGPPYAVVPGQIVARELDTGDGHTYRNTTGGIVPAGGAITLEFQAEVAGSETAQITVPGSLFDLATPLAGVTISAIGAAGLTSPGLDEESDERLTERCVTKWSGVIPIVSKPADGYVWMALQAGTAVTRVYVDDSVAVNGAVHVYIARAGGVATGPQAVAGTDAYIVKELIEQYRPVTATVDVFAAAAQVQNVTADVYLRTALNTPAKQAEVSAAIVAYLNSIPINGTVLNVPPNGYVLRSELLHAATNVEGVVSVDMTVPAADVAVGANDVVTAGAIALNFINV